MIEVYFYAEKRILGAFELFLVSVLADEVHEFVECLPL
jgi:hypothetical protein